MKPITSMTLDELTNYFLGQIETCTNTTELFFYAGKAYGRAETAFRTGLIGQLTYKRIQNAIDKTWWKQMKKI